MLGRWPWGAIAGGMIWILGLGALWPCQAQTIRLRVVWGGEVPQRWSGQILVEGTQLVGFVPLGIDADEPGSMWQQENVLFIRAASPRHYDGVDLLVRWAPGAQLKFLQWRSSPKAEVGDPGSVTLKRLAQGPWDIRLDETGSQLVVRRLGGDGLYFRLTSPSILPPRAPVEALLAWNAWGPPSGNEARVMLRLRRGRQGEVLHEQQLSPAELPTSTEHPWHWRLPAPEQEGVYTLEVEVVGKRWPLPLARRQVLLLARRQFVVLDPRRPLPVLPSEAWQEVSSLDPTSPRWWQRLQWPWPWPWNKQQPPPPQVEKPPWGRVMKLPGVKDHPVHWTRFQLSGAEPGKPHLLELQVPAHLEQTLVVSILEPDATGKITSLGVDSGVEVHKKWGPTKPGWMVHRLLFWPRTDSPWVVVAHRQTTPAWLGKLRLLRPNSSSFPSPDSPRAKASGREVWAHWARPLFPETFLATVAQDPFSGRSLDDWQTFYEAGTRLVQYLQWAGYTGAMVCVYADGSTIYPSRVLQPTPRYDTGVFLDTGEGWQQKDVLELLFELFDRQGLTLVPSLDFSTPLPELEAQVRQKDSPAMRWVNPQGELWTEHFPPQRGRAMYYNALHPQVQQAMLRVVEELVRRYGHHRSFGGVGISLGPESYAVLLSPPWGMDPETLHRFLQDRDKRLPQPGLSPRTLPYWVLRSWGGEFLQWRKDQLTSFYEQMVQKVQAAAPQARVYLLCNDVFLRPDLQGLVQPQLERSSASEELWNRLGLDLKKLHQLGIEVVLGGLRRSGHQWPERRMHLAVDKTLSRTAEGIGVGSWGFFHLPEELPLEDPRTDSVFAQNPTWLVAQVVPLGVSNRARFAQALARRDLRTLIDGGWSVLLGQEEWVRTWFAAFSSLPPVEFRTFQGSGDPLVVRWASWNDATYVYLVNPSPWPLWVQLTYTAPPRCQVWKLPHQEPLAPLLLENSQHQVEVAVEGYGLEVLRFSAPGVVLRQVEVPLPGQAHASLGQRAAELLGRLAQLRSGSPALPVANADFEAPGQDQTPVPQWILTHEGQATARVVQQQAHSGKQCLLLENHSGVVSVLSQELQLSGCGRVAITAWLRTDEPQHPPTFRLAIQGTYYGQPYYRYAALGTPPSQVRLSRRWRQYVFLVPDLPLQGLEQVRVRLDLLGSGRVWVDDVAVYELLFNQRELVQLSKEFSEVYVLLQRGEYRQALERLEGYWAQLLLARGPAPPASVAQQPRPVPSRSTPSAGGSDPSPAPGSQSWWRRWLPSWLR